MKAHTSDLKNNIKLLGRELSSKITYELNGEEIELGNEDLNSITPHYEGAILKSVMKQLDIDSNIYIEEGTVLNYKLGVKVGESYEYIDFGNYIVYSIEKQEDVSSYLIKCYDKLIYSMKEYETPKINNVPIAYPITVRDYINAICEHLGLTFANRDSTFANYDKQIQIELYLDTEGNSLGYTFRDVLDELAQATASTICINNNDELEIRYINDTADTIDEEYLKDVNVKFGETTKPINTIVLSRAGGSDKISISHPIDLPDNEKNAIVIADNQIMNFNDRDTYLSDILYRLNGLTYSLNDFSSTGICYYDLCDKYNVQIEGNTYSCIMFNDEINITQGLEELIHTDLPEETKTDYTKTDKTDRRINQTYLIVDKQNQAIEGVVSQVGQQNEQIATIRLQYNELISKISDIADITTSGESTNAKVLLAEVNSSQPINVKIHPIVENISYLYPYNGLYPSSNLYLKSRKLRFTNTTTGEIFDWILPTDLWYYDSENYDELELSYGDGTNSTVIVTRKCKINADGTISLLDTPTTETYTYPSFIILTDGNYEVKLIDNNTGYLYVQLMAKNIYTTQFYTKAETNSLIDQTTNSINLSVDTKLSNYSNTAEMNSAITLKANEITSSVSETYATKTITNQLSSRISQTAKDITLQVNNGSTSSGITIDITKEDGTTSQATGTIEMNGLVKFSNLNDGTTTISGSNIKTGTINGNNVNVTNINASNITGGTLSANRISGGTINANNINVTNLSASNITRGTLTGRNISGGSISGASYSYDTSSNGNIKLGNNSDGPIMGYRGTTKGWSIASFATGGRFQTFDSSGNMGAYLNQRGASALISDKRDKKNIEAINIDESVNIIKQLNPVKFNYNDNVDEEEITHRGLIAQEVEHSLIDIGLKNQIYEINKEGRYLLNYVELIPDLINCIKYLNEKIEKLEKESDK